MADSFYGSDDPQVANDRNAEAVKIAVNAITTESLDRFSVVERLMANGYSKEESESAVDEAYRFIDHQPAESASSAQVTQIGIGALLMATGIILTMIGFLDRIWYGAVIVGLIFIIKGILPTKSKPPTV